MRTKILSFFGCFEISREARIFIYLRKLSVSDKNFIFQTKQRGLTDIATILKKEK